MFCGVGTTQIDVELFLLEHASKNQYDYYHLLSGVDLPLKSQDYIHQFFDKNNGKEFINFDECVRNIVIEKRVKYYYFFVGGYRSQNLFYRYFTKIFNRISRTVQNILGISKIDEGYVYRKGSQWFSITHSLAKYVLDQRENIKRNYRYSFCCDEVFLQTIVYNSPFFAMVKRIDEKYNNALRYIDWEHGNPYVFKSSDFNNLIKSKALFARKFNVENIDVVKKITQHILNEL